jgi:hypothetical protein
MDDNATVGTQNNKAQGEARVFLWHPACNESSLDKNDSSQENNNSRNGYTNAK